MKLMSMRSILLYTAIDMAMTDWRLWIRALWIGLYASLLVIAVPLLVLQTLSEPVQDSLLIIQLVGGLFALLTVPISFWEIVQHLSHYTKPHLQKHVIRILWMVPIYSVDAWFSLIYPDDSIYINSLRDCYTAYVIYNFMRFLLNYLHETQPDYEQGLAKRDRVKHIPPCCCLRPWPMGPRFVKRCLTGILQFVALRPLTTAVAFICEMLGVYGENEFRFDVAFLYLQIVNNVSQMVAMYCLVLFYKANRAALAPMSPLGKFFCIKFVVFLTAFQSAIISLLVNAGVIQLIFGIQDDGDGVVAGAEIKLVSSCLQNLLICVEMFFAAIAHHFVFSYRPYVDPDDLEDLYCCEALASACCNVSHARSDYQRLVDVPEGDYLIPAVEQEHKPLFVQPKWNDSNNNNKE